MEDGTQEKELQQHLEFFSPLDSLNNVKIKTLLKNHAKIAAFPFSGLKFENLQFGWITIWNEFVETLIL